MSCTPTPTATLYATHTTFSTSTSFSQTAGNAQLTTVVQQSCVASGTINGSSIGCVSSTQITQVNTLGGGQTAQVPVIVTVPVEETQPTQTLFAPCNSGAGSSSTSQTFVQSSTNPPLTSSVLVETTPPPSTVLQSSTTTLADGSVVQTVVTVVTTPPPTSVYVPTAIAPTLQSSSSSSQGSGTNVAPIVGGVLGGFVGLIAVVVSLWWLCRRRRSWDDIFEKDEPHNQDAWTPGRERDSRTFNASAEPQPYQYGLVGHVVPPAAAGEALRMSHYSSVSGHSGTHSRGTSLSTAPLLQATHKGTSRPSTAGSVLTVQTQPGPRVLSPVSSTEREHRSLSMASYTSSTRPPLDSRSNPASFSARSPNMDELAVLEPLNRTGSPVPTAERRVLQIVNDTPSPADIAIPPARRPSVILHTDGGRVPDSSITELDASPPAYSR